MKRLEKAIEDAATYEMDKHALLAERDVLREQVARLKTELEHYETEDEIRELLKRP